MKQITLPAQIDQRSAGYDGSWPVVFRPVWRLRRWSARIWGFESPRVRWRLSNRVLGPRPRGLWARSLFCVRLQTTNDSQSFPVHARLGPWSGWTRMEYLPTNGRFKWIPVAGFRPRRFTRFSAPGSVNLNLRHPCTCPKAAPSMSVSGDRSSFRNSCTANSATQKARLESGRILYQAIDSFRSPNTSAIASIRSPTWIARQSLGVSTPPFRQRCRVEVVKVIKERSRYARAKRVHRTPIRL